MSGLFRLTSKKQKKLQKWFCSFAIFSLFLQIFSGVFTYQPVWAVDLKSEITFDKGKNSFNIFVNTPNEVSYLLAYQTNLQTEVVKGTAKNDSGNFSKEIYAGTCTSNGTCTPHQVLRGILKIEVKSESWLISKSFTIENGSLNLVEEGKASSLDLTTEENNWLSNSNQSAVAGAVTAIEKVCLDDNQTIINTTNENWNINLEEGWAQTKEGVKLGVKYLFPQENNVTVTFKCLPQNVVAPLKIQKIKISDLNLPEGTNPYGEWAYDITTSMQDGTFEYDVTLPKPEDKTEVEVSYIEKTVEEVKNKEVKVDEIKNVEESKVQEGVNEIKANDQDHFTIFLVTGGKDKTGLISHTLNVSDISELMASDNNRYESDGQWPIGDYDESQYIQFNFSPNIPVGSIINGVSIIFEYQRDKRAILGGYGAKLEICNYNCANQSNWHDLPDDLRVPKNPGHEYPIENSPYDETFTINIPINYVNTVNKVNNLKIRFLTFGRIPLLPFGIQTKHDYVALDVNYTYCGDGAKNGSEECDGSDLGGLPSSDFSCNRCQLELINPKVTICHATSSYTNPYEEHSPNKSADLSGHNGHNGPIWYPGITGDWGDIIPPFYYIGGYYSSKNWTTDGQAIWNNGCNLPKGTLTVKKIVTNDNGGTKAYSDFSFSVNGNTAVAFEPDGQNDLTVNPGIYTITEPVVVGYSTTYNKCSNISVPMGGSATCTITNDDIQPKLTVTKVVSSGDKQVSDFPLFVNGNSVTSGQQIGINANQYTVSETNQPHYTGVISGDCTSNGDITLNPGDVKSCVITNTYVPYCGDGNTDPGEQCDDGNKVNHDSCSNECKTEYPITFEKEVTGGDAQPGDWSFNVLGYGTVPNGETVYFVPGYYPVTENGPDHYNLGSTSGSCHDSDGNIELAVSNSDPNFCRITNVYEPYCGDGVKNGSEECDGTDGIPNSDFVCNACKLNLVETDINICHATASNSNPYIVNSPDKSGDLDGHNGHNGPIWYPGITVSWGDIIPDFYYWDNGLQHYPGKNWTTEGQVIYRNGCEFPKGTITFIKDAQPNSSQVFNFTYASNEYPIGGFPLIDDGNGDNSERTTFSAIPAGVYSWSEDAVLGWDLNNIQCIEDKTINSTTDLVNKSVNIILDPGENVTCTFTNVERGSIVGHKFQDNNMNSQQDGGEGNLSGWTIGVYKGSNCESQVIQNGSQQTDGSGNANFPNLVPGNYSVKEEIDSQSGWQTTTPICQNVTVVSGQQTTVNIGNFQLGKAQGCKFDDINGDGLRQSDIEGQIRDWKIRLYKDNDGSWIPVKEVLTGNNGPFDNRYYLDGLTLGTYYICEENQAGWTQTGPNADNGVVNQSGSIDEAPYCRQITITTSGQTFISQQFGNVRLGNITACKYDDYDGDGQKDENEPGINGVNINLRHLYENGSENELTMNGVTGENGCYTFENLLLGNYRITEDINSPVLAGYSPSDGTKTTYDVSLNEGGQTINVDFFNDMDPIKLGLEKTSDKIGLTVSAGDTSNFTLTVTNNALSTAYGVSVRDVLPNGFSYLTGTTRGTGWTISEPTQSGQQLTWNVGNIPAGESRTITYQVKINSSQANGCYPDVAVASGTNRFSNPDMTTSYSNFAFVYTCLGTGTSFSASVGGGFVLGAATAVQGEVLGAATGSPTILLIAALLMIFAGVMIFLKKGKKFHV